MERNKLHKFSTLLALYVAQAIPMSFFSTVVPVIMRQEHYSLQSIGLLQLVKLPWIIKFLWAPLVDKTSKSTKQYKKWIFFSEFFYAITIMSAGFFSLKTDFNLIIILMILAFVASATQDIATDAYAILILKKEEKTIGNSIQSSGSFIGTLCGSGILLVIYYYLGWKYLLFSLALFVLLALIPLHFYKKTKYKSTNLKKVKYKDIRTFFTQKYALNRILLLSLFYSGIIGTLAMLKPYMVDLNYSIKEIGFISGLYGTSIGAISSFFASYLIKRKRIINSSFIVICMMIFTSIFFLIMSLTTPCTLAIYLGVSLIWGIYGMATVIVFTSSMNYVREGREGTDFTLQIVITHLSSMIIAILSGHIAHKIGYSGLYCFEIALGIVTLLTLTITKQTYKRNKNDNISNSFRKI